MSIMWRDCSKEESKKNRKGVLGCINYPNCSFASPYEPLDEKCPQCGSVLLKEMGLRNVVMKIAIISFG